MNITPLTPLTDLHICTNLDFSSNYENVIEFKDRQAQLNYFNSKTLYTFEKITPVKLYNSISVPLEADKLITASYMFFRNANFSGEWMFAFITDIQYVNPNNSVITYEIDSYQTYQFRMQIKSCFIERETVDNDAIGNHLIDEGLDTGEIVTYYQNTLPELKPSAVLVGATVNSDLTPAGAEFSGNVFSGIHLIPFDLDTDVQALKSFIKRAESQKAGSIIGMVQMPKKFAHASLNDGLVTMTKSFDKHYNNLDGYVPENNKLFCYPYNFLNVSNNNGVDANFKYEFFNSTSCGFELTGTKSLTPEIIMYPKSYKMGAGSTIDELFNFEEKLVLNGFPTCAWTSDAYLAYLAQNSIPTMVQGAGSVASSVVGNLLTGNVLGAVTGGVGSALNTALNAFSEGYKEYIKPPQAHGTTNTSANYARGIQNFTVTKKGITHWYAKRLDKFFKMYGYKVNYIGTPNLKSRTRFNYVKTSNCQIYGSIPNEDIVKLQSMFDNGIRIWHETINIGNYNLPNPIIKR